jgi:hypothetical protein
MYQVDPLNTLGHTGFIAVEPVPADFIAGGETGILEQSRIPSGNWQTYLSPGKLQRFFWTSPGGIPASFETDACVSFSAIDAVQAYMNWMSSNGGYSPDNISWLKENGYFDVNGRVNLSPRFMAKVSNTTTAGNSLPAVANALRTSGAVPVLNWDAPLTELESLDVTQTNWFTAAWNIYYTDIPSNIITLGLEFAKRFDVMYEWIAYPAAPLTTPQFLTKLQVAPLQVATAVCPPWNTDQVILACGAGTAHATLMDSIEPNGDFDIRDHYNPFDKKLSPDYTITYAMRIVVGEKQPIIPTPVFIHHFALPLFLGQSGVEVVHLQDALKADGEFPMIVLSTGFYGPITQAAVLAFQRKYQVDTPQALTELNGTRVGPKTIIQLNNLFNK